MRPSMLNERKTRPAGGTPWAKLAAAAALAVASGVAWAANTAAPLALKRTGVPEPPELSLYVKDKKAAVALGKALFWDMQVGSDGVACATCHYHAGADHRSRNQVNPGLNAGDHTFTVAGANGQLRAS